MDTILKLLESNAHLTPAQLAVMCDKTVEEVQKAIEKYEENGTIVGYKTLVDWDKTDRTYVNAMIELKVAPQKDLGFDRIAEKICLHPEVQSVHLMSGGYDLLVVIEGKTMREISDFVFKRLATMDGVVSTATHFILKKYKDKGVIYNSSEEDKRGNVL
jgi:DNA-binding Lrp family transcriptional regulator